MSAPVSVGARENAVPLLGRLGFGSYALSLAALIAGSTGIGAPAIVLSANLLAMSMVLAGSNIVATILNQRDVSYGAVAFGGWASLIAGSLAVCAAPIAAASFTMQIVAGRTATVAADAMISPALATIFCVLLGLATDLLRPRLGVRPKALLLALLSSGMLALLMLWGVLVLGGHGAVVPASIVHVVLLMIAAPFALRWIPALPGIVLMPRMRRMPGLFAAGMAVLLPLGLLLDMLGVARHEAVSLAIVFGLFAGVYRLDTEPPRRPIAIMFAEAQFGLLLAGAFAVLVPLPPVLKAVGAAMAAVSIGLFAARLLLVSLSAVHRAWEARQATSDIVAAGYTP